MLTSEERERIRRAYYIDHQSVRHISVEQGHSRDTINRIIAENPPSGIYRRVLPLPPAASTGREQSRNWVMLFPLPKQHGSHHSETRGNTHLQTKERRR